MLIDKKYFFFVHYKPNEKMVLIYRILDFSSINARSTRLNNELTG